jgi:hypothetical protein
MITQPIKKKSKLRRKRKGSFSIEKKRKKEERSDCFLFS